MRPVPKVKTSASVSPLLLDGDCAGEAPAYSFVRFGEASNWFPLAATGVRTGVFASPPPPPGLALKLRGRGVDLDGEDSPDSFLTRGDLALGFTIVTAGSEPLSDPGYLRLRVIALPSCTWIRW
eukprot:345761-Rhodomonas_salina.1